MRPDGVHSRHADCHRQLADGLAALGLELLVEPAARLPMLNAVKVPPGVDEAAVRARLLHEHRIEIGTGLGPLAGKVWRIGIMGHTARTANVARLLNSLREVLRKESKGRSHG